ncbi:MAG: superoxide dismutase [Hyphomonadaceae bacterium]
MPIALAPLPFDIKALEPHMSARTLEFHHGKHHKAYVDNTNAAIKGTPLDDAELPAIIRAAKGKDQKLFNNSAQVWNHDFFWQSLSPAGAEGPSKALGERLTRDFGGVDAFKAAFKAEATGHFASGWAWLIARGGKLEITSFHDADSPIAHDGVIPLLTADVWEHAYYLDYQNARPAFVDAFLNNLVNWRGVEERIQEAAR